MADDDGRMYCYRHPDRVTYVRCGRCDRPICTRCALQGPVGFRCRLCGTLAHDPLTSIAPTQAVRGLAVAIGGGVVVGAVGVMLGFVFSIFVGFIGGGMISEAVVRTTGYKRGPLMLGIVFGGIAAGVLVGMLLIDAFRLGAAVGPGGGGAFAGVNVFGLAFELLPLVLISAGAACVGAYYRLR